jgi:3-carboxy-cis,cis-muconate cycloisomerase
VLSGDVLKALHEVIIGLQLFPERMKSNLALSGGLITAEAVMMALGKAIGRQVAHEAVHHAARVVATGEADETFLDVLSADPRVAAHLSPAQIADLLDPTSHTGLSASLARATSARARAAGRRHRPTVLAPALDGLRR